MDRRQTEKLNEEGELMVIEWNFIITYFLNSILLNYTLGFCMLVCVYGHMCRSQGIWPKTSGLAAGAFTH